MKEYEIVYTYLNGCAGEAHPIRQFEEAEMHDPADYIRQKHSADFHKFVREDVSPEQIIYRFDNGCVVHIYEFTEL